MLDNSNPHNSKYSSISKVSFFTKVVQRYAGEFFRGNTYSDPEFYNEIAIRFGKREKLAIELVSALKEYIPEGGRMFERAAGTGLITKELIKNNFDVMAGDINETQLNFLKNSIGLAEENIVVDDINDGIPFEDNAFDGVIQVLANRYFTKSGRRQHISESYRVLKPGGVLIFPLFFAHQPYTLLKGRYAISSSFFNIPELRKCGFSVQPRRIFFCGKLNIFSGFILIARKPL